MRLRYSYKLPAMAMVMVAVLGVAWSSAGADGVVKVLPQFLDLQGRHTLTPSLYDRDAYQAYLQQHPAQRSGLRFAVNWRAKAPRDRPLKLRVELRGVAQGNQPKQARVEETLKPGHWYGHWTNLVFSGDAYREFGDVTAWRVTLWDGEKLLGEQKSFLW